MKIAKQLFRRTLEAGLISLTWTFGLGQSVDQIAAARDILEKIPAAERASKSAQLVAEAPAKERAAVAAAVGHAVAKLSPDLAPAAVTAISAKVPTVAPAAAAAAAVEIPDSAGAIAQAAVRAPGVILGDVRSAVIAAVPKRAAEVVSALARPKTGAAVGGRSFSRSIASARAVSLDSGGL